MSNNFETLLLEITPPFAYITLNRPQAKNAMTIGMVQELLYAFESLRDNKAVRAVVLSGAGGTFCAGGDIKEMAQQFQNGDTQPNRSLLDTMLRAVNQAPQIVIAKLQGAAMGGGFGLVCVSDIAIADTSTMFGLPEVRLGLAPALISPFVIQRLGLTRARQLMLTGTRFNAQKAFEYGLIHDVCAPDELDAKVNAELDEIRQCSPNAIAECKKLMFEVISKDLDSTVEYRAALLDTLRRSEEGIEGMMSFVEKRPARWTQA